MGAPLAQTPQPGVTRGGSVFRCSTELADQCEPIPFDVTGSSYKYINSLRVDYFFFHSNLCALLWHDVIAPSPASPAPCLLLSKNEKWRRKRDDCTCTSCLFLLIAATIRPISIFISLFLHWSLIHSFVGSFRFSFHLGVRSSSCSGKEYQFSRDQLVKTRRYSVLGGGIMIYIRQPHP